MANQSEERAGLTVGLPKALVEQADALVRHGAARSRNRLIVQAVAAYLRQLEEALIDRNSSKWSTMNDSPSSSAEGSSAQTGRL